MNVEFAENEREMCEKENFLEFPQTLENMEKPMIKFELTFNYEKSTKNTYRFQEQTVNDEPPVVGALYVQKSRFPDGAPSYLTVTIE